MVDFCINCHAEKPVAEPKCPECGFDLSVVDDADAHPTAELKQLLEENPDLKDTLLEQIE